ncbi:hypothetical protein PMAYCL1PPCAC_12494 [Pristionchus mayeri]|uniref:C2H2-type domain-containing protein n=1 Tax=Pristionchus mayeri TaxID=1317129 RepID=A0AAN4ZN48_9BILA|nr:hypothetical protein PMAYCL1PPCAC_12494 [Pristionchus mayeri]
MASVETGDCESPFKLKCKQSTLDKMRVMSQLSEALNGAPYGENGLQFASLIPVGNIISAIVMKNRQAFNTAVNNLRALIAHRKRDMTLQDIAVIAEINFLEGFDSFISYIHTGPADGVGVEREEEDTNTQSLDSSIRSSPIKLKMSPGVGKIERVPKTLDDSAENDKPSRKSTRCGKDVLPTFDDDNKGVEAKRPTRKSIRSQIYDGEFNCVFDGCTEVFNSAMGLKRHAEECAHKSDLQLVFRCSSCNRSFTSDKAVKAHIGHFVSKCPSATINIMSDKDVNVERGEEKLKSVSARRSSNVRRQSLDDPIGDGINQTHQVVDCPFKGCTYASDNFEHIYSHVKNAHSECITAFKCLKCGDTRISGKAMKNHIDQCTGAKVELRLSKKIDQPEVHQWEINLRSCPIQACNFISPAARLLSLHFKRTHSESKLSFQCSKCSEASASVQAVIVHCKTCEGSEPQALVDGGIGRKSRGSLARHSTSTSTMTMRKRGRPSFQSSSKKRSKKGEEVDVADMPVLEMIEADNEIDKEEESGDNLSMGEVQLVRVKEEEEDDGPNM